jgi:hypothetical protein
VDCCVCFAASRAYERGSILSAPVTNLSDHKVLLSGAGDSLKDIQVFTKAHQQGTNPCALNNGGCSELCLFNGTHPVCACAHGIVTALGTCEGERYPAVIILVLCLLSVVTVAVPKYVISSITHSQ